MQFIATLTRRDGIAAEVFSSHLKAEVRRATELYDAGVFRQLMSRTDGQGAVLVIEAASEAEALDAVRSLPMVEADLLTLELHGVGPYRGFTASLKTA